MIPEWRQIVRGLLKQPGFLTAAILSLGPGMAARDLGLQRDRRRPLPGPSGMVIGWW
jgi:hypothetical protein